MRWLGAQPQQRARGELQAWGGALAVFGPFATAARWLGWYSGGRSARGQYGAEYKRLAIRPWCSSRQAWPVTFHIQRWGFLHIMWRSRLAVYGKPSKVNFAENER